MVKYEEIGPCPECFETKRIAIYLCEGPARRVECQECDYSGPIRKTMQSAIVAHNLREDRAPNPALLATEQRD